MAKQTVKLKFTPFRVVSLLAVASFVASATAIFPQEAVENIYSRRVFPTISHSLALLVDRIPFSLLDILIPAGFAVVLFTLWRRRWAMLLGIAASFYLWFFWTWGLNYHRLPVEKQLGLDLKTVSAEKVDALVRLAAAELNRLYAAPRAQDTPPQSIAAHASLRVRRVAQVIDGQDFQPPSRIKRSLLADLWFGRAGIEGMFNPYGHETLVNANLLPVELPFVLSHEMAHVRGVAHEGEANLVALLATVASDDPAFQYSGWLNLWQYMRSPGRYDMLEPGPRKDLAAIYARMFFDQVKWATNVQSTVLDLHLKSHAVPEGVRSYSRIVSFAIASQSRWDEFR